MDAYQRILVVAVGFLVSIVSVSVGGTALITVPLLIWLGMEPRVAVATNKFAILFLSVSGAMTFLRSVSLPRVRAVYAHAIPVAAGSLIGAAFVVSAPQDIVKVIIACATIVVALALLLKRGIGVAQIEKPVGDRQVLVSLGIALPLSVYGGFFTGGYATLLTYLFVCALGLTFLQAAAATRLMSIFSAAAASILLGSRGAIDYSLGIPLAVAFVFGARLGARIAIRRGSRWLKAVFVGVAIALSARLLGTEIHRLFSGP
jgi:uncharacterized membrane protein YfcA